MAKTEDSLVTSHLTTQLLYAALLSIAAPYRVELLHLLPQHARDHPDETPVFQFTCLLIKISQQRPHSGAFTMHTRVPVHTPDKGKTARAFHSFQRRFDMSQQHSLNQERLMTQLWSQVQILLPDPETHTDELAWLVDCLHDAAQNKPAKDAAVHRNKPAKQQQDFTVCKYLSKLWLKIFY